MTLKFLLAILAPMCAAAGIFASYYQAGQFDGLAFSGGTFPWISFVATVVSMLLGIFCGTLYRNLSAAHGPISIGSELRNVFGAVSFWSAMCVAPIVFLAIYTASRGAPGDPASFLLAFQNGFFWETVFKRQANPSAAAP